MSASATHAQIRHLFAKLSAVPTAQHFPPHGSLAAALTTYVVGKNIGSHSITQPLATQFASSSIEMWHRSVHSFLISCALTPASPLWASVAGYYSSHYVMRGFAHLFGYFQLYTAKRVLQLSLTGSSYACTISAKTFDSAEHKAYWKIVKLQPEFATNPFFTSNDELLPNYGSDKRSDVGHRNKANYTDHIGRFPQFSVLDERALKSRLEKLSGMYISDVPFPRLDHYPDLDHVQLIAYHRMIAFKDYVDNIFGDSNAFWKANRRPPWFPKYLDFQVVQPNFTPSAP